MNARALQKEGLFILQVLEAQLHTNHNLLWMYRYTRAVVTVNAEVAPCPRTQASHAPQESLQRSLGTGPALARHTLPCSYLPPCAAFLTPALLPPQFVLQIWSERSVPLESLSEGGSEAVGCPCSSYDSTAAYPLTVKVYSGERETEMSGLYAGPCLLKEGRWDPCWTH